jgi:hypothetical protein
MTSQPTPIADALGFEHEAACPDRTDDSLLFVERYVGEESRRIRSVEVIEGDVVSITLGSDAVSDEPVGEVQRQWVECRYCTGAQVGVPTDVIDYE